MTAGSIAVPTIIPLRQPVPGKSKLAIDSSTKIEIHSDSLNTSIHYTINGSKPEPFKKIGQKCTMPYRGPFTLPAGRQTVKAVAVSEDGMRESNVVTKTFDVEFVEPPLLPPQDDDLGFQDELDLERSKLEVKRAASKLMTSTKSAWTDVGTLKDHQQRRADMRDTGNSHRRPYSGTRFLNSRMGQSTDRSRSRTEHLDSLDLARSEERRSARRMIPGSTNEALRLFEGTDFLNFTPGDPGQRSIFNNLTTQPLQGLYRPESQATSEAPRPTTHASTQTVGLFYPMRQQKDDEKSMFDKQLKDRKPLLTPVSPGRGYWRKQVEHICQHLKIYTQNNAEFRALIGEPKMGKLIEATVQEDGYEMSLTVTFPLRGGNDKQTGKRLGVSHQGYLSQHTLRDDTESYRDSDDYESEGLETPKSNKKKTKKTKAKKKPSGPKLSTLDQRLLKELGIEGEGAATEVQQLLDDGADVNCVNKNGLPALYVAVRNKQIDSIPILIDAGADINKKGPSSLKGNTALHDAVNLGPSGLHVIEVLLENGADQNRKNDRGETPLDLAKKAGYDSIITKFASAIGMSQLAKMTKPKN